MSFKDVIAVCCFDIISQNLILLRTLCTKQNADFFIFCKFSTFTFLLVMFQVKTKRLSEQHFKAIYSQNGLNDG